MGRIRTVKPELFTHEELYKLEMESGLPVIRSFVGLFTCCDREGRFKWRPNVLKLACAPFDTIDFSRVLDALWTRGFIMKYAFATEVYGVIPTFLEHQVINNRESASTIPAPEESSYISTPLTREARVHDASGTRDDSVTHAPSGEGKGREGKGNGREGVCPIQGQDDSDIPFDQDHVEKRAKRRPSDEDFENARWLYGCQLGANPEAKPPNFTKWADDVRLMREIDGRTHKEIASLFRFAKNDAFWSPNIQSPGKLREKWDQLTELRARPGKSDKPKDPRFFGLSDIDCSGDKIAMAASMEKHGIVVGDDDDLSFDLPGKNREASK